MQKLLLKEGNFCYLKPFLPILNKLERYYQTIAINRAVKAVLEGKKMLMVLAPKKTK
jgi:hypothetical protein